MNSVKYLISTIVVASLASAQTQPPEGWLKIQVIEGEGAFNSIKGKTGNSPVVVVRDEQDHAVSGATVRFLLPSAGPGATFASGDSSAEVKTDESGRAMAPPMRVNSVEGRFNIKVTAAMGNRAGNAVISQTNTLAGAEPSKHSNKTLLILVLLGGGAAAGAAAGLHGGKSAPVAASPTPITLSVGGISVGPPAH
ncbi:MAG TPA: hypothetical protein VKX49_17765 [Bryobacteraceae bacterium]|nr:hypothetical protein [Bryobacteraceae bacterium]